MSMVQERGNLPAGGWSDNLLLCAARVSVRDEPEAFCDDEEEVEKEREEDEKERQEKGEREREKRERQ